MLKKNNLVALMLMVSITLGGCATNSEEDSPLTTSPTLPADTTVEMLTFDTVEVICSLQGKTVLQNSDIRNLRDMSYLLEQYQGVNETEIRNVSARLQELAATYEPTVGIELPSEVSEQLVLGCVQVRSAYEDAYGVSEE